MASLAPTAALPSVRPTLSANAWAALTLFLAAILLRATHFGDPAYQIDEQFYLLVGDRMLHGALPFVDIWDRKPIGLFLLYAAIRLLGGEGLYQYQIVASLFAAATAVIIYRIALPRSDRLGAMAAGLLYLLWIETVEGGGGQSPIFYNPLMAGAAWCVLAAGEATHKKAFLRHAFGAMTLVGLAIQIKYTAVVEGFFFGIVLAWWTLRRASRLLEAFAWIGLLAGTALAPTLAALAFYAAIGQLHAFWFANFTSIFLRAPPEPYQAQLRLHQDMTHVLILGTCMLASLWMLWREKSEAGRRWMGVVVGWTIFAIGGFFSVGMYYCHYLLPLYVPLAAASAPIFRWRPVGPVLAAFAMWIPFGNLDYPDFSTRDDNRGTIAAMMALIPADVTDGCMQMLEGPPILYKLSNACFLTPYIFPDHLIGKVERNAIGVDQAGELRRVLRLRPRAVVVNAIDTVRNPIVRAAMTQAYQRAGRVMFEGRPVEIWVTR